MTSLYIGLNAYACIPDHICSIQDRAGDPFLSPRPFCHSSWKCGRDLPLSSQDPGIVSLVQEWESVAAYLAAGFTPGRLRLSVVCDTLDYAAAQSIVRPISRLPLLASCAIRLGQLPNHGLRRLAESTARQVTGLPPSLTLSFDGTTSQRKSSYEFYDTRAFWRLGLSNGPRV